MKHYRTSSPTIEQNKTIKALAETLKIKPPQPATETEARHVIDDLRWKERRLRRGR